MAKKKNPAEKGRAAAELVGDDMVNSNYRDLPTEESDWLSIANIAL